MKKTQTAPFWLPLELSEFQSDIKCALGKIFPAAALDQKRRWKNLASGQSNFNFRFEFEYRDFFIQFFSSSKNRLLPYQTRTPLLPIIEFDETQRSSSEPLLRHWCANTIFESQYLKVTDWSEGIHLGHDHFKRDEVVDSIVGFLARLHTIDVDKLTNNSKNSRYLKRFSMGEHLSRYRNLALNKNPEKQTEIDTLVSIAEKSLSDYDDTCLCHNDLSRSNMLWHQKTQQLTILDWEYLCYSDPLCDLAGLITSYQLDDELEAHLISQYESVVNVIVDKRKLDRLALLNQSLGKLWLLAT